MLLPDPTWIRWPLIKPPVVAGEKKPNGEAYGCFCIDDVKSFIFDLKSNTIFLRLASLDKQELRLRLSKDLTMTKFVRELADAAKCSRRNKQLLK